MELELPEHRTTLLEKTKFVEPRVVRTRAGYFLREAEECWTVVWGAGSRRALSLLSLESLEQFKREFLEEIEGVRTEKGI